MLHALAVLTFCLASSLETAAMVGGAPVAKGELGSAVVLISGARERSCTGVALARYLILTAAHCMHGGANYRIVARDRSSVVQMVSVHLQFDRTSYDRNRATADVALVKLAAPIDELTPARLGTRAAVSVGERFVVAGFGVTFSGTDTGLGVARSAQLIAVGQPSTLQLRLGDPTKRGETAGLGACEGDSGAPVFESKLGPPAVIGVVSWSTGPQNDAGYGGLTGVTPLMRYKG